MAFLIDQLNNSGLFAQSAYSAGVATCDSEGNVITATYLTGVDLTPYQTISGMVDYQTTAGMTGYATTGDVANKLDTTAFSDVSGTFLTAHQSLDGYATTSWVDSQGYLTAHQPISADEWNNVYDTVNVYSGSWTGSETSPTASVDSNGSIDIVSSNNTVYFDVNGDWFNDAVNSAVDVPTGVMVESACEYNAVNEISGYNGSAIAQYGAEKQWLVHDDTLVHAANSAQYALGVNLSAVAQLLGVDETVLFSGTGATGAFSEPLSAFKKVEFHLSDDTMIRQVAILYPDEAPNGSYIVGAASVWIPNTAPVRVLSVSGNMNEFSRVNASYQWWSKADGGFAQFSTSPVKVIGIGRKQA